VLEKTAQLPFIQFVQAESKTINDATIISALFKNCASEVVGQKNLTAIDATAALTFRNSESSESDDPEEHEAEIHVNFGLWFNTYARYATFAPNASNALVVVVREGNQLSIPECAPTVRPGLYHGKVVAEPEQITIPWTSFTVEVFIFCKNVTLFHDFFLYESEAGGSLRPTSVS